MLLGYPNTRKREEALVGAYFGIYDDSLTARNKGTLAGGPGCCWSGGGLVVVWVCMVSLTSKGGSGKTGGWFRERGESIPTHPLFPFPNHCKGDLTNRYPIVSTLSFLTVFVYW